MSSVMPQQLPKDDEEEEDEEHGEEFVFDDSDDDEKPKKDMKDIDSVPVHSPESVGSEATENSSQTGTNGIEFQRRSPPAGQEVTGAIFIEGNILFLTGMSEVLNQLPFFFCFFG